MRHYLHLKFMQNDRITADYGDVKTPYNSIEKLIV